MYLPEGTVLNKRYIIERLLGHGGFGITYAALDKLLNVRVAIKEYLPRQLATRAEGQTKVSVFTGEARQHYEYGLRKFMEEAKSVAKFSHHPNIVSAYDYFEANGTAYMVMEYVEGVTLKQYLEKKGGRISFEEAKGIMMPVMDALREVHQGGLLHRDVSPDNIYITTSAQVKILDFGAARYFAGEQSKSLSVILKPGYAPEEQYRSSGKQGTWTDVYAVGATLYKALTGRTPPEALDRKEEDTLEPPSQLGVDMPPAAEQALLKALGVRADQRFQTIEAFQQALMGGEPITLGFTTQIPSFQPDSATGYPQIPAPVTMPSPVFSEPSPLSTSTPVHYPSLPQRSTNSAAIAAGIGAGILGVTLLVLFLYSLVPRFFQEDPKARLLKEATTYVQAGNYQKALPLLEKARELDANDAEIHLQLAKTYHGLRQHENGLKACQEVLRINPANVEAHFLLGMEYLRRGQKDLAMSEYDSIKDKKPLELGERLLTAINSQIQISFKQAKEFLDKGIAHYKAQNYLLAESELRESLKLNPQEAVAYSYLGLTYAGLNRIPEAIRAYREAINLKPDFPEVHLNLGVAYDKLERTEEAIEAWKTAIRYKPDLPEAFYNLAMTYWHRGEKDLAAEHYKILQSKYHNQYKALQEKLPELARYADRPTPPRAEPQVVIDTRELLARGREHYQAKQYKDAQEVLKQVVSLNPGIAEAHYLLGMTYASQKPPREALGELRKAIELKPDTYTWSKIGTELAKLNRTKEAAEAFKEALKANPNDSEARSQLQQLTNQPMASIDSRSRPGHERRLGENQRDHLAREGYYKSKGEEAQVKPAPPPEKPADVQFGFGPSIVKPKSK